MKNEEPLDRLVHESSIYTCMHSHNCLDQAIFASTGLSVHIALKRSTFNSLHTLRLIYANTNTLTGEPTDISGVGWAGYRWEIKAKTTFEISRKNIGSTSQARCRTFRWQILSIHLYLDLKLVLKKEITAVYPNIYFSHLCYYKALRHISLSVDI